MITNKYHTIMLAFSATLPLTACKKSPLASGPEAEAKKAGQAYWDALITKCGDYHYSIDTTDWGGDTLTQLKDPQIITSTIVVNEAAKLNGLDLKDLKSPT